MDTPADAIVDTHLPWFERPKGKIDTALHGMFLAREDWPLIERALNAAGFVVVRVPPSMEAVLAGRPIFDEEGVRLDGHLNARIISVSGG